jgi:hypothetical protein
MQILNPSYPRTGILVEGSIMGFDQTISIINFYGPYSQRQAFWDRVSQEGVLSSPSVILGGDLNFTLSVVEVWGAGNCMDPLSDYFGSLFLDSKLVDILPNKLLPTWSNGREGSAGIAKRLDRFLMAEALCECLGKFISWTIPSFISDHKPICLELDVSNHRMKVPFKFNHSWLQDEDFSLLVREKWTSWEMRDCDSPMDKLVHKLKFLKK